MRSVNHMLPSGPSVIPNGSTLGGGCGNTLIAPAVVTRLSFTKSVNHNVPSGRGAIAGWLAVIESGLRKIEIDPAGVILPMVPVLLTSVNQILPSGPAVIAKPQVMLGSGDSVTEPEMAIRATLQELALVSVNQMLPSDPAAIPEANWVPRGNGKYVITPALVTAPIRQPAASTNQTLPSGPKEIAWMFVIPGVIANSVIVPPGVILPTFPPPCSKNQTFPSAPAVT